MTYHYDHRGNLIEVNEEGREKTIYTFDSTNLLVKAESEDRITEYQYDGLGNRIRTNVIESGIAAKELEYVIDPLSEHQNSILTSNHLTKEETGFVYGNGLIALRNNQESHYYRTDEKNSVTGLYDASGSLIMRVSYDEYGTMESPDAAHLYGTIFSYTGYAYEDSIELYYAKARYYNPKAGFMISEDPIRSGQNWYIYAYNNPIMYIDSWGLDAYVYYLPEWKREAKDDRKRLMRIYNLKKSQVHLIEIKNPKENSTAISEFAKNWNSVGVDANGDSVDIDAVIINTHAAPGFLTNNDAWYLFSDDVMTLNDMDVGVLILYGCNAGHLDHQNTNMASAFASKVNNAPVLAADGSVYSSGSFLWLFGAMTYTPKISKSFIKARDEVNPNSFRQPMGWIIYQQTNAGLTISSSQGMRLTLTDLIDKVNFEPRPQLAPIPTP